MAVGTDTSARIDYVVRYESYSSKHGWTTYSKAEGYGYATVTSYKFPTRKRKPIPLSNTRGSITRTHNNMSEATIYLSETSRITGPLKNVARGDITEEKLSADISGLSNSAQKRLNSRDLNLGVILVEGRETYGLLANAAKAVSTAYKQLKARDAKGALKTLGVSISGKHGKRIDNNTIENGAANSWLQIQFGWLPLLNDVYTAVGQSYDRLAVGKELRGRARRGSKRGSNTFDPNYVPSASVSWSGTVSSPRLAWLQSFGLLNPLTLAWEATRLSYLVDWFFQINTFLNTLTSTAGLSKVRSSSVVESIKYTKKGSTRIRSVQIINRTLGASISLGNPLNFDMGGWHVATALAQIKQIFRNPR